jgi:outer membrane biosynthesis protein TonB
MTKKESDSESSKPASDSAAGEPKAPVAVVEKKDEAAVVTPTKEEAPAKEAEKSEEKETKPDEKQTKTEEVSSKDFEIKEDELAQESSESKPKEKKEAPKDGLIKIKDILTNTATNELYQEVISRKDGLNHLLLTDINLLLTSIANDFPEIAKTYSIGQSFEGRDINVIEISGNGKVVEEKIEAPKAAAKE